MLKWIQIEFRKGFSVMSDSQTIKLDLLSYKYKYPQTFYCDFAKFKTYLNLLKAFRIKNTGCFFCSPQIFVTRWYLKLIQIWLFLINLSNTKWWSERGWIFDSIHLLWNTIYLLIRWMNTSRVKYSIIGTDFLIYLCL